MRSASLKLTWLQRGMSGTGTAVSRAQAAAGLLGFSVFRPARPIPPLQRRTVNPTAIHQVKRRSESGQTLVEFAIAALVFLTLVFVVIDFSYLYFNKLTLQNAVRQAGRYAITGQAMPSQTRYASILQTVQTYSLGRATSSNTTICGAVLGCGCGGGPGETVTITVTYQYQFITPLVAKFISGGAYAMTVSSSFKNEPFPPGLTY